MRILNILSTVIVAAALSACSPVVYSDADPTKDFSSLRTFSWAQDPPLIKTGDHPISPLTSQNMATAIRAAFEAKGYRFVSSGQADFAVSFTMGARDEIQLRSYPVSYMDTYDNWGWGRPYYGVGYRPPFGRTVFQTEEVEVTKGTLSVDAFDVIERRPIWHAQASKSLSDAELAGATATDLFEDAATIVADFPSVPPSQ